MMNSGAAAAAKRHLRRSLINSYQKMWESTCETGSRRAWARYIPIATWVKKNIQARSRDIDPLGSARFLVRITKRSISSKKYRKIFDVLVKEGSEAYHNQVCRQSPLSAVWVSMDTQTHHFSLTHQRLDSGAQYQVLCTPAESYKSWNTRLSVVNHRKSPSSKINCQPEGEN